MRYKFYREHKYVCAAINDVERLIAKTDFSSDAQVEKVKESFNALVHMLKGHAHYENDTLHELLKKSGSAIYHHVEEDHLRYEQQLQDLATRINAIILSSDSEERIELGYQLYIWFRKFAGDNLLHLHEEETVILPELQRLYSDKELSRVEFHTYKIMTAEQLVHMMEVLFPHMNPDDRKVFLTDIKTSDPSKFALAWQSIKAKIDPAERSRLADKFGF